MSQQTMHAAKKVEKLTAVQLRDKVVERLNQMLPDQLQRMFRKDYELVLKVMRVEPLWQIQPLPDGEFEVTVDDSGS